MTSPRRRGEEIGHKPLDEQAIHLECDTQVAQHAKCEHTAHSALEGTL
jgi:hypothetical protein